MMTRKFTDAHSHTVTHSHAHTHLNNVLKSTNISVGVGVCVFMHTAHNKHVHVGVKTYILKCQLCEKTILAQKIETEKPERW